MSLIKRVKALVDQIIHRFFTSKLWIRSLAIMILAVIIRWAYWVIAPEIMASDSTQFLEAAQGILHGKFTTFLVDFPFHMVYSFLLVPGYIFPDGLIWYIPLLHISSSAFTVVLIYLISQEISQSHRAQFLAVIVAMFYPYLLFWMKFILTDVIFTTFLTTFILLMLKLINKPNYALLTLWSLVVVLLFFTRPVALLVLVVSIVVLLTVILHKKYPSQYVIITGVLIVFGLVAFIMLVSRPEVNQKILSIPTISQSLWLSTHVVSGTFEDYANAAEPREFTSLSGPEYWKHKSDYALNLIVEHPFRYLQMAAVRFFNFFYPWVHPQWSLARRVFDAVASIGLTITALVSLKADANKKQVLFLLICVLALGLTTAFSQIDIDGRYRLPADILLIPVSSIGIAYIVDKISPYRSQFEAILQ